MDSITYDFSLCHIRRLYPLVLRLLITVFICYGSIYAHPSLSESVGTATAAFAMHLLDGDVPPGVWFPEEEAVASKQKLLERCIEGNSNFVFNKAAWTLEEVSQKAVYPL